MADDSTPTDSGPVDSGSTLPNIFAEMMQLPTQIAQAAMAQMLPEKILPALQVPLTNPGEAAHWRP